MHRCGRRCYNRPVDLRDRLLSSLFDTSSLPMLKFRSVLDMFVTSFTVSGLSLANANVDAICTVFLICSVLSVICSGYCSKEADLSTIEIALCKLFKAFVVANDLNTTLLCLLEEVSPNGLAFLTREVFILLTEMNAAQPTSR